MRGALPPNPRHRLRHILLTVWREIPRDNNAFMSNVMQAVATATSEQGYNRDLLLWAEARVAQMLAATKRKADEVIGVVPPRWAHATVEKIAINGVLAGCEPDYMPTLIAAVEAITDPKLNLYALQATTASAPVILTPHTAAPGSSLKCCRWFHRRALRVAPDRPGVGPVC